MLYTLNSAVCKLYLNKTRRKKNKELSMKYKFWRQKDKQDNTPTMSLPLRKRAPQRREK